MKLVISIEIDDFSEIESLETIFAAIEAVQNPASVAKTPLEVDIGALSPGLTDSDDGVDDKPEPPKPKRKKVTKKRTRKTKGERKKVAKKIPKELPPEPELPPEDSGLEPDDELTLVPKGQETSVMADPIPEIPVAKKEKSPDELLIETDEKVVKLRDDPEVPDSLNPNVIFSELVQVSLQSAVALLKKHGLTRFSQAEGETLVAMVQDAQLLLAEAS